jgi:hypothetical protein
MLSNHSNVRFIGQAVFNTRTKKELPSAFRFLDLSVEQFWNISNNLTEQKVSEISYIISAERGEVPEVIRDVSCVHTRKSRQT